MCGRSLEYLVNDVRRPQTGPLPRLRRDTVTVAPRDLCPPRGPRKPQPAGHAASAPPVARLRRADWAAAEELFSSAYPRLAGWVRRLVDDDETAHEIASEAFTRLLARWSALDNPQ